MKILIYNVLLISLFVILLFPSCSNSQRLKSEELESKFFQLCDLAVEKLNLPERTHSADLGVRRVPYYIDAYAVRALAVAYDLTNNEKYLNTIKTWSDRMITNQEKMIPKGGYYMNYGRKPFETEGEWYVADCGEISMGILATSARCSNAQEKRRYLNSVESYANLVLENYIGPNGGITDGLWSKFDGECTFVVGYAGQVFFKLYNETGDKRYLEAGLNATNYLNSLEAIRNKKSGDSIFLKYNPPVDNELSSGMIMVIQFPYLAGLRYVFSNEYLKIKSDAKKQINLLMDWYNANLLGKGESGKFEKYDVRKGGVGGKFGSLPFHIYVFTENKIVPKKMLKIADKELQKCISEVFSYESLMLTEFTCFTMLSMAEKISPGSVLRNSKPLYEIVNLKLKEQ